MVSTDVTISTICFTGVLPHLLNNPRRPTSTFIRPVSRCVMFRCMAPARLGLLIDITQLLDQVDGFVRCESAAG